MQSLGTEQILKLIVFVLSLASGQLLFKKVADAISGNIVGSGFILLISNPWFWLAITLYGISTLLWIHILQSTPISIAYPFVALAFVIVPMGAWFIYGEPLNTRYFIGTTFLIIGILIMHIRLN